MRARIDDSNLLKAYMNTISSKFTAFAAALVMNSLIMGALGYLFEIQSHPHMSVLSFARAVATHQWLS
jgi:Na+-transporting NADH:ubiquinone oxidoreductase subunit NqrD